MAKILMFGNQKGGVGKSQCSVIVATALSRPPFNLKVAIVDIDEQKSIVYARKMDALSYGTEGGGEATAPFDVFDFDIETLQNQIADLDKKYQVLLIDAAGKLDAKADVTQQEVTKSLMYIDFLFLPFVAGNYNLDSTLRYLQFILQLQKARVLSNRQLTAVGFVNMYRSRSRKTQFLLQDIEALGQSAQLPFMKNYLNDYALFSDADTFSSLYEPNTTNDPAKQNFQSWFLEFCKTIKIIE